MGQAQSRIAAVPWYQQDQKAQLSLFEKWVEDEVYPHYFRWVKGPYERYHYNRTVADLRAYGLMFDDKYHTHHPLIERVIEILPQDLAVGRYRRLMRASEMSLKKTHLPLSEQNYDGAVHGTIHRGGEVPDAGGAGVASLSPMGQATLLCWFDWFWRNIASFRLHDLVK